MRWFTQLPCDSVYGFIFIVYFIMTKIDDNFLFFSLIEKTGDVSRCLIADINFYGLIF